MKAASHTEYLRGLYDARRAAGECVKCGATNDTPGFACCGTCRGRMKKLSNQRRRGLATAYHPQESPRWAELDACTARCVCGLLLPCGSCLPTIDQLADTRPGAGRTYPEGQ